MNSEEYSKSVVTVAALSEVGWCVQIMVDRRQSRETLTGGGLACRHPSITAVRPDIPPSPPSFRPPDVPSSPPLHPPSIEDVDVRCAPLFYPVLSSPPRPLCRHRVTRSFALQSMAASFRAGHALPDSENEQSVVESEA